MTEAKGRWMSFAAFVTIVLGGGVRDRSHDPAWQLVRVAHETILHAPELAVRPGVDDRLPVIAVAGWRMATIAGFRSTAFRIWLLQMILNWAWTPVFFGFHQIGAGLGVILRLLAVVLAFMLKISDGLARWCAAPYALWLCYASALNAAIFVLN